MLTEGPQLEALLYRLANCPPEFIETCSGDNGGTQLLAIIADHFRAWHASETVNLESEFVIALRQPAADIDAASRHWGVLSIAVWLLHDDWFLTQPDFAAKSWEWLASDSLRQLAEITRPQTLIADPDRREELVRLCLHANGLRPAGESDIQATDRLNTLDSVRRQQLLQETAAAERRAREIREAMARKKAMESASRYGE